MSELAEVLDLVGHALGTTLRAALDGDRVTARRVLRGGGLRREALARAARATAYPGASAQTGRGSTASLLLVSDLDRVSRLVDQLARHVATTHEVAQLSDDQHEAILLLARYGQERLHQLSLGPAGPDQTREYLRCGQCLFDVLACLDARHGTRAHASAGALVSTGCCAALTASILQASRHASRVA